jgi:hypothetical protein
MKTTIGAFASSFKSEPSTPAPATELSFAQAGEIIRNYLGRSPQDICNTMHRAVECCNWLGALFQCIEEEVSGRGNPSHIQSLSSLGAYVASDYQVSIIGESADEMQNSLNVAAEDAEKRGAA